MGFGIPTGGLTVLPGQLRNVSGFVLSGPPKLPSRRSQTPHGIRTPFPVLRGRVVYVGSKPVSATREASSSHDHIPRQPFLLSLVKDFVWSVRTLFTFLAEQPSQLRYIEWPSFNSTLKTATLSLVLVAVFIVALSSVDSALCYILALVLRKAP